MELKLSEKQLSRIKYECNLLRMTVSELYIVAPHLFHEGVTAANTVVENFEELKEKAKEVLSNFGKEDYIYFD